MKGAAMTRPFRYRPTDRKLLRGLAMSLLILTGSVGAAWAQDELGRLFFTPERRQSLDRQRQLNIREKQEIPEDPTLTINGLVTRSSGKRTVWINGVAQSEKEDLAGVTVIPARTEPGRITVQPTDAPAGQARVGDTINRTTGEASNLLGEGRITVRPSSAGKP